MKKVLLICTILTCFILTGCAASHTFLKGNQKDLVFKPQEGGILLSFVFNGSYKFIPNAIYAQEINQYKPFNKRPVQTLSIPKPDLNGSIYLLNARLPKGTYLLTAIGGVTPGFFSTQVYAPCGKMVDVKAGKVIYVGRINAAPQFLEIEDHYKEDTQFFTAQYPILQSDKINKDMLY